MCRQIASTMKRAWKAVVPRLRKVEGTKEEDTDFSCSGKPSLQCRRFRFGARDRKFAAILDWEKWVGRGRESAWGGGGECEKKPVGSTARRSPCDTSVRIALVCSVRNSRDIPKLDKHSSDSTIFLFNKFFSRTHEQKNISIYSLLAGINLLP